MSSPTQEKPNLPKPGNTSDRAAVALAAHGPANAPGQKNGNSAVDTPPQKSAQKISQPQTKQPIQRDDRIPFSTNLRFESDDGCHVISGTTADVSMSGAFLSANEIDPTIKEGSEGVVFLEMTKEGKTFEVSFHCAVARITPRGMGLNFEI